MTVWQSIAQVRARYRDDAGTIIANHRTKIFYSGISDPDTFELATRLVGDEQVVSRQLSTDLAHDSGGRRQSVSENTVTTALVPGHVLRRQSPGSALLIHGSVPPAHLQTRSPHDDPQLLERAMLPVPGRDTDPDSGTGAGEGACEASSWLAARLALDAAPTIAAAGGSDLGVGRSLLDPELP